MPEFQERIWKNVHVWRVEGMNGLQIFCLFYIPQDEADQDKSKLQQVLHFQAANPGHTPGAQWHG